MICEWYLILDPDCYANSVTASPDDFCQGTLGMSRFGRIFSFLLVYFAFCSGSVVYILWCGTLSVAMSNTCALRGNWWSVWHVIWYFASTCFFQLPGQDRVSFLFFPLAWFGFPSSLYRKNHNQYWQIVQLNRVGHLVLLTVWKKYAQTT